MIGRKKGRANAPDDLDEVILQLVLEVRPPADGSTAAVTDDTELRNDLGLDSLAQVALAFRLEEVLGIPYNTSLEYAQEIVTLGDLKAAARDVLGSTA